MRNTRIVFVSTFIVAFVLQFSSAFCADELAAKAFRVFDKHCSKCHGPNLQKVAGFNVHKHRTLTRDKLEGNDQPFVVPRKPDDSRLWEVIKDGEMPPEGELTDAEKEVVREWIEAGATDFPSLDFERPFVSEEDVQSAILRDLRDIRASKSETFCRHQRYFSLAHIHNNRSIPDADLQMFKAALSKTINSLSKYPKIVVPRAVDKYETVFAINMRDYGWSEQHQWDKLLRYNRSVYPYALKYTSAKMLDLSKDIEEMTGNPPYRICLRGDWFVAVATRPPLYHELLALPGLGRLPESAEELEAELSVDTIDNFKQSDFVRGAVNQSGVSQHNRVMDRHRSRYGYYWESFDFDDSAGVRGAAKRPLGPVFSGNTYPSLAFTHAGGELIFSLPNRLQGYLLVDSKGHRIDVGPTNIVSDDVHLSSGSPRVVNGLSCMVCHQNGIRYFKDVVRDATGITSGEAGRKIKELYIRNEELQELLKEDEVQFLEALLKTVGGSLNVTTIDALRSQQREPIHVVVKHYHGDLSHSTVVAELGSVLNSLYPEFREFTNEQKLKLVITSNPDVRDILGSLLSQDGVVKRTSWHAIQGNGNSEMQQVMSLITRDVQPVGF